MEVRSILVNMATEAYASVLAAAVDLAERFDAELIGVAAAEPSSSSIVVEEGVVLTAWYEEERAAVETMLSAREQYFSQRVPRGLQSSWHAFVDNPTRSLAGLARGADLIVSPSGIADDQTDLGEVVLRAGRPLIALADGSEKVSTDKILLAWKDTREARRAASDALPLLRVAKQVLVVAVVEGDQGAVRAGLGELMSWLKRHGVMAREEVLPMTGSAADILVTKAVTDEVDLIVSGAYGHSRFREWLFGGVTRDLLRDSTVSRFLAN